MGARRSCIGSDLGVAVPRRGCGCALPNQCHGLGLVVNFSPGLYNVCFHSERANHEALDAIYRGPDRGP